MDDELMTVPVPLPEPSTGEHELHPDDLTGNDKDTNDGVVVVVDDESASAGLDANSVGESENELHAQQRACDGSSSNNNNDTAASGSSSIVSATSRARGNDKGEPAMMLPSFIWDYFIKEASGKYVVCTLCPDHSTRFAYSGGTSTMNRHLRKKHQKYAPGKCAADYEYTKGSKRVSPRMSSGSGANVGLSADATVAALETLSPTEIGRRQLIDLRNSRRRASTKRRKLLHPALLDADPNAAAGVADFDAAGFSALHGHPAATSPGTGLQFPPGFELSDGAMDMTGDQRFFDYSTLTGASGLGGLGLLGIGSGNGLSGNGLGGGTGSNTRSRRHSTTTHHHTSGQSHKVLTHRLLKYLIAQYEPLDVSRMGMELNVLLYGTDYPTTRLPAEDTLKRALANLYYSQREILKEVIAEVDVLSLSLNNWQSVFGQNVLTVTGHWISHGFSRRDCVLEVYVLPLDESVNTIALLRDVMDKWDIPSAKVAALTMIPNGKDDASAIHDEYPGLAVVSCFVNVLDSAVTAGLRKCAPLIRRCRNYVSYFIQNPSEYQIFLALQRKVADTNAAAAAASSSSSSSSTTVSSAVTGDDDASDSKAADSASASGSAPSPKLSGSTSGTGASAGAGGATAGSNGASTSMPVPALSVICDFADRWNSTSEMICRIVELEHLLLLYKHGLERDTNPHRRPMQLRFVCCELAADEWTTLKELARLLEPIEGVVHVSPLEYPGLSIVYPLLHGIKKHVDDAAGWIATPLVAAVRHAIANGLTLPLCTSGAALSSPYLASLLDPRFKRLPFLADDERARIVELLKLLHSELLDDKDTHKDDQQHQHMQHVSQYDKKQQQVVRSAALSSSSGVQHLAVKKTAGLLHEFFPLDAPTTELEKLTAQVQQYLESPSLPATDESENDPLEWWSRYQRMFPFLAKLAKKFLCIAAVSRPCYEAFTNYGQLMQEKKARLDIEVAAQILFCRSVSRIPEMDRMNV